MITTVASIWHQNMPEYLSANMICSEKGKVISESKLLRPDYFCGQISKYIFVPNGGFYVFMQSAVGCWVDVKSNSQS